MLKEFLESIKPYKEYALLLAAAVGLGFGAKDYIETREKFFATREDVFLLRCQHDNQIDKVDAKARAEVSRKEVVSTQRQIYEVDERLRKNGLTESARLDRDQLSYLRTQIETLNRQLADDETKARLAQENLKPGFCENYARLAASK
jgi:hypothetical protein